MYLKYKILGENYEKDYFNFTCNLNDAFAFIDSFRGDNLTADTVFTQTNTEVIGGGQRSLLGTGFIVAREVSLHIKSNGLLPTIEISKFSHCSFLLSWRPG